MAIMKYQLLDGLPLATAPIRYLHFNLQLGRLCHTRINRFIVQGC